MEDRVKTRIAWVVVGFTVLVVLAFIVFMAVYQPAALLVLGAVAFIVGAVMSLSWSLDWLEKHI